MESMEPAPAAATDGSWRGRVARLAAQLERMPWLLPLLSFGWGWISFMMVRRGEDFARLMALLAFIGWPWLLIEPFLRKYLERKLPGKVTELAINFITQSLQQELLFFSLPFIFGALQWDVGQIVFAATVVMAALVSTIDPIYNDRIAANGAINLAFHGYCSWLAALVVLPMAVHLPLERAMPVALAFVIVWLAITLKRSLALLPETRQKLLWIGGCICIPLALWLLRGSIPAAGLSVRDARIAQDISELTPGEPVTTVTSAELRNGVVAFVQIRAPMGVAQSVIFEWRHNNSSERIPAEIHGGSNTGWRTWSRKRNFPPDAQGRWTVDVVTPQGQLLKRMHFTVSG